MGDLKYKINKPDKGEKNLKIFLGGDLSINCLGELTENLKQVEKDFSEFEITLSEVTVFDLASIQLLLSLKKTVEKHKKKIKFKIDLPKEYWELIETSGFLKDLKNL